MSAIQGPPTAQVFNLMHGFIVGIGKNYCHKSQPDCDTCPLRPLLPRASSRRHAPKRS